MSKLLYLYLIAATYATAQLFYAWTDVLDQKDQPPQTFRGRFQMYGNVITYAVASALSLALAYRASKPVPPVIEPFVPVAPLLAPAPSDGKLSLRDRFKKKVKEYRAALKQV